MNFFTKLMQDATPKAEAITNKTKQIVNRVASANAVQQVGKLGYNTLVNTVGIAMVVAKPAVVKVGSFYKTATQEVK